MHKECLGIYFGAVYKVGQHFLGEEGSKIEEKAMTNRYKKSWEGGGQKLRKNCWRTL